MRTSSAFAIGASVHSRLLPCVHLTLEIGGLRAERTLISGGSSSRSSAAHHGRGTGNQCPAPCTGTLLSVLLGVYAIGFLPNVVWGLRARLPPQLGAALGLFGPGGPGEPNGGHAAGKTIQSELGNLPYVEGGDYGRCCFDPRRAQSLAPNNSVLGGAPGPRH